MKSDDDDVPGPLGGYSFSAFAADVCGILTADASGLQWNFVCRGEEIFRRRYSGLVVAELVLRFNLGYQTSF